MRNPETSASVLLYDWKQYINLVFYYSIYDKLIFLRFSCVKYIFCFQLTGTGNKKMNLARKFGALFLAAASVVTPSASFAQDTKMATSPSKIIQPDPKPDVLSLASDYSTKNNVVAIAIAVGKKDTKITGDMVGQVLSRELTKAGAPSKYFFEAGGDYTAVAFFVRGLMYGPYGLDRCIAAAVAVSDDYDAVKSRPVGAGAPTHPAAKPATPER